MADDTLELLLLHALPLDGSMWKDQIGLLPGSTYAPTLYTAGDRLEDWAAAALATAKGNRLIVVGCSVGGSCALEVAAQAPDRVAALVLIGTKADLRPDPTLHATALEIIENDGLEAAFTAFWAPLFSRTAAGSIVDQAKAMILRHSPEHIANGVTVFHTRPNREKIIRDARFPIVFVTGADDIAPGPKRMAAQAELAQRGRLHVIPDCGHYVPLEKPEILNTLLRSVIDETLGAR